MDDLGTRVRLEKFAGLLRGDGTHAGIESLTTRMSTAESRLISQNADFGTRIRELERKVSDLQLLVGVLAVLALIHWATAEYGEQNVKALTGLVVAVYCGFVLVRAVYRRLRRPQQPGERAI